MIQASELRIGNRVDSEEYKRKFTVCEITKYSIKQDDSDYTEYLKFEAIFGIPLTPEILMASGFAQSFTSDPQEPDASQVFEIDYLSIHQHSEKEKKFYWYNGDIEIEIKSLHQLQNLHFSLFNKDLQYNPQQ